MAAALGLSIASSAFAADPAEMRRLLVDYVATNDSVTFAKIKKLALNGVVENSLEFCLTRTNAEIKADLPKLRDTLRLFGSRGDIANTADGSIVDVTFWGDGEETLSKVHGVPEFTEFMSLSSFVDVRTQTMGPVEWTYCSVTNHGVSAPESTKVAEGFVERLSKYRGDTTVQVGDFKGTAHELNAGKWGSVAWMTKSGNARSFYAVDAQEIGVKFEFHRIVGAD